MKTHVQYYYTKCLYFNSWDIYSLIPNKKKALNGLCWHAWANTSPELTALTTATFPLRRICQAELIRDARSFPNPVREVISNFLVDRCSTRGVQIHQHGRVAIPPWPGDISVRTLRYGRIVCTTLCIDDGYYRGVIDDEIAPNLLECMDQTGSGRSRPNREVCGQICPMVPRGHRVLIFPALRGIFSSKSIRKPV